MASNQWNIGGGSLDGSHSALLNCTMLEVHMPKGEKTTNRCTFLDTFVDPVILLVDLISAHQMNDNTPIQNREMVAMHNV